MPLFDRFRVGRCRHIAPVLPSLSSFLWAFPVFLLLAYLLSSLVLLSRSSYVALICYPLPTLDSGHVHSPPLSLLPSSSIVSKTPSAHWLLVLDYRAVLLSLGQKLASLRKAMLSIARASSTKKPRNQLTLLARTQTRAKQETIFSTKKNSTGRHTYRASFIVGLDVEADTCSCTQLASTRAGGGTGASLQEPCHSGACPDAQTVLGQPNTEYIRM